MSQLEPRADGAFTYTDLGTSTVPIHHMPGHYIRRLQQVAVALFARRLDRYDITPVQYAALAALAHNGTCDQATLAALIGYDRATIGGVIDRLLAKHWVAREASRTDRRMKLVSLTAAGAALVRRVTRDVELVQADLMAPLSAAQRRQFERLCLRLLAAHVG
jgi:DNA-binding MarR family transcriptional regulator